MSLLAFVAVAALVGACGACTLALFTAAMIRAFRSRRGDRAAEAALPRIQDALVLFLAGGNDVAALGGFAKSQRPELTEAILGFRNTVSGATRDRLCDLALDLGLVRDWCEGTSSRDPIRRRAAFARLSFACANESCRRVAGELLARGLEDTDREVRLAAARALIQTGARAELERVFEFAISQPLLVRILLADHLRRHAMALCERAIPEALRGPDARVRATLEMVVSWERAIPVGDLASLLMHRERSIRLLALRLATASSVTAANRAAIVQSLADEDVEICAEAAVCAGRLKLEESVTLLARCLRRGPAELARNAAEALAAMPPAGLLVLEEMSAGPDAATVAAALSALAGIRGRTAAP
jgi:HEAT repeat protein